MTRLDMTGDDITRLDPPPRPPEEPDPADCCGEGCVRCIYDVHDEAVERYRKALQAWRERNPGVPLADGHADAD
ncbi:oxidoreductase-like domain-containing protein [Novilysobacter arseniciresistens]